MTRNAAAGREQAVQQAVIAYLSNNQVAPERIPDVTRTIRESFSGSPSTSKRVAAAAKKRRAVDAKGKGRVAAKAKSKPNVKVKAKVKSKTNVKAKEEVVQSAKSRKAASSAKLAAAPVALPPVSEAAATAPFMIEQPIAAAEIKAGSTAAGRVPMLGRRDPSNPFVPIAESVQQDYLVCLEDGRKFKMLKRHLRANLGMSPDEYRTKWGLPPDYPMVAPGYAKEKSDYAKMQGLGSASNKAGKRTRVDTMNRTLAHA